jgi:hypothetical protein
MQSRKLKTKGWEGRKDPDLGILPGACMQKSRFIYKLHEIGKILGTWVVSIKLKLQLIFFN